MSLEHSHQVCQMPNIWHLAHQTTKIDPHEVCQMPKNLAHCYSTVSNMRRYGHQCYKFFPYFIHFSLSSQHISLRLQHNSLSLSPLWSPSLRCSLFLSQFHFFLSLRLCTSFSFFFFLRRRFRSEAELAD